MNRSLAEGGSADATLARIARLMAARLAIAIVLIGSTLAFGWRGGELSDDVWRGLSATLGAAFLATAVYGALHSRVRRAGRFGAVQIATDVALVSSLVHFSGGSDSVFISLYVPVIVYGALLFDRRGAFGAAALAATGFGAVLALQRMGALVAHPGEPVLRVVGLWSVHAGALVLVALLASILSLEMHRAGEALDASRRDLLDLQRLHARTVESLLSGLLTVDPSGRITSFNPEAERITALSAAAAIGRSIDEVLPGARELVMGSRPGGDVPRSRARMPHRNARGELLHLGLAGSILRGSGARADGHVVIFQDVTQVVAMEKELRRSVRLAAAGQLAADLAHEIRNPLASMSGSIQILRGELGGEQDDERRRLMDIVLRETDRLNALITDFLQYAKPAPPRPEAVELATLVEELGKMFDASRPPNVALRVDVPAGLRSIADPAQLRQLLWNLVINAVQAMPEGGELRIAAAALGAQDGAPEGRNAEVEGRGAVEITVSDDGVGIPAEVLDRIFDPFFTTKREGTGLGLATVHRILEAHGGTLRVESTVGSGTAFHVRLPRAEEES